jgi:hypothetical protein
MEFIENPYKIIKSLSQLIDRFAHENIDAKVYITTLKNEYAIYLEDNTFILVLLPNNNILFENLDIVSFLKWVNQNIFDIVKIELDINLTQMYQSPIVFYDCNKPGCYYSSKERLKAARVIQKYAIPRYNNPERPEVRERLMREFNSLSFGKKNRRTIIRSKRTIIRSKRTMSNKKSNVPSKIKRVCKKLKIKLSYKKKNGKRILKSLKTLKKQIKQKVKKLKRKN